MVFDQNPFFAIVKWPKINFWTRKKFKTAKNAISQKKIFIWVQHCAFWNSIFSGIPKHTQQYHHYVLASHKLDSSVETILSALCSTRWVEPGPFPSLLLLHNFHCVLGWGLLDALVLGRKLGSAHLVIGSLWFGLLKCLIWRGRAVPPCQSRNERMAAAMLRGVSAR